MSSFLTNNEENYIQDNLTKHLEAINKLSMLDNLSDVKNIKQVALVKLQDEIKRIQEFKETQALEEYGEQFYNYVRKFIKKANDSSQDQTQELNSLLLSIAKSFQNQQQSLKAIKDQNLPSNEESQNFRSIIQELINYLEEQLQQLTTQNYFFSKQMQQPINRVLLPKNAIQIEEESKIIEILKIQSEIDNLNAQKNEKFHQSQKVQRDIQLIQDQQQQVQLTNQKEVLEKNQLNNKFINDIQDVNNQQNQQFQVIENQIQQQIQNQSSYSNVHHIIMINKRRKSYSSMFQLTQSKKQTLIQEFVQQLKLTIYDKKDDQSDRLNHYISIITFDSQSAIVNYNLEVFKYFDSSNIKKLKLDSGTYLKSGNFKEGSYILDCFLAETKLENHLNIVYMMIKGDYLDMDQQASQYLRNLQQNNENLVVTGVSMSEDKSLSKLIGKYPKIGPLFFKCNIENPMGGAYLKIHQHKLKQTSSINQNQAFVRQVMEEEKQKGQERFQRMNQNMTYKNELNKQAQLRKMKQEQDQLDRKLQDLLLQNDDINNQIQNLEQQIACQEDLIQEQEEIFNAKKAKIISEKNKIQPVQNAFIPNQETLEIQMKLQKLIEILKIINQSHLRFTIIKNALDDCYIHSKRIFELCKDYYESILYQNSSKSNTINLLKINEIEKVNKDFYVAKYCKNFTIQ